jgi:hypothetical protein
MEDVFWDVALLRWVSDFRRFVRSWFLYLQSSPRRIRTFETLEASRPMTQPHIPDNLHCQQHRCENLKFRKWREGSLKYGMATSFLFSPSSLFPTVRPFDAWLYGLREKCFTKGSSKLLTLHIYIYIYIYTYLFMDKLHEIRSGWLTALWTTTATTTAAATTTTTTTSTITTITTNTTTTNYNNELCWTETNQIWVTRQFVAYFPLQGFD